MESGAGAGAGIWTSGINCCINAHIGRHMEPCGEFLDEFHVTWNSPKLAARLGGCGGRRPFSGPLSKVLVG